MENAKEVILAKWLSGEVDDITVKAILPDIDLEGLREVLDEQNKLEFVLHPKESIWEGLQENIGGKTKKTNARRNIAWWIVPIVILLGLAGIYWSKIKQNEKIIIDTNIAATIDHKLIDGSIVHLAPNSSLMYNAEDWKTKRIVKLIGQASFDVESGSTFQVHTRNGLVEVLGTEFEVFELDENLMISCFEGSVKVVSSERRPIVLNEKEMVSLVGGQFSKIKKIENSRAGFLNNRIRYNNVSAKILIQELKRFYEVEVETDNLNLEEKFTGLIITNDINKACSYIAQTFGWKYQLLQGRVIFSK